MSACTYPVASKRAPFTRFEGEAERHAAFIAQHSQSDLALLYPALPELTIVSPRGEDIDSCPVYGLRFRWRCWNKHTGGACDSPDCTDQGIPLTQIMACAEVSIK